MNLRILRILGFMLIAFFFQEAAVSYSQDVSPGERVLAIEARSEKMINQVDKKVQIVIYLRKYIRGTAGNS